jgi:hypothetical protein
MTEETLGNLVMIVGVAVETRTETFRAEESMERYIYAETQCLSDFFLLGCLLSKNIKI